MSLSLLESFLSYATSALQSVCKFRFVWWYLDDGCALDKVHEDACAHVRREVFLYLHLNLRFTETLLADTLLLDNWHWQLLLMRGNKK